jgi:hypothetical protein
VSHGVVSDATSSAFEIDAHLGHYLGTIGFFVPAALLVALVVVAVVRDRRLHGREDDEPGATPPPAD